MDAVLLVDKPAGKTSHDVVAAVRREHGGRRGAKVGHAGTLDPFATAAQLRGAFAAGQLYEQGTTGGC